MSLRERRLIRRLRDRDERAFRELVEEHRDRVYNLTYRMLGNREEAEDVAQEVFITVFKSIDSFRGDAKLSTWLYRVTANHCKNRIKYLARRHDRQKRRQQQHRPPGGHPGAVVRESVQQVRHGRADGQRREGMVQLRVVLEARAPA